MLISLYFLRIYIQICSKFSVSLSAGTGDVHLGDVSEYNKNKGGNEEQYKGYLKNI